MRVLHFHDVEQAAGETGKIPCIIKSEKKRCYPAGESLSLIHIYVDDRSLQEMIKGLRQAADQASQFRQFY